MATDEDARAAARRIVEQVLASQDAAPGDATEARTTAPDTAADGPTSDVARDVVDDALEELTGELGVVGSEERAEELVRDAVAAIAVDEGLSVEVAPDSGRARARALVAEVLAADERGTADPPGPPDPPPAVAGAPLDRDGSSEPSTGGAELIADDPAPESASRLRARELVATVLAEDERRLAEEPARQEDAERAEAAAATERQRREDEQRRLAEARRAEEERAAAERAERERREREREAEAERERWADADRDVAGRTVQLSRQDIPDDAVPDHTRPVPDHTRPVPVADHPDATAPLSVAELAASERAALAGRAVDETAEDEVPMTAEAAVATAEPVGATATRRATDDPRREPTRAPDLDETGVLEATIDVGDLPTRPRIGRWLLASILGAVTLAIVFPLAIRALLQLVALS
ncbi:MAG: hypothetical protein WEB03_15240 [Nitriliruptor sp.]|uniref:hypothetical protein n=1 Tax=Nitriliruptor sp. TaxID=2448056 RepID=UPI00349FD9C4